MALTRKFTSKIYEIHEAHEGKVKCLDLGETGGVLVTGGVDGNVNLWAIGSEKYSMSLTGHDGHIECVKFALHDDFVYSADGVGVIQRWDLNSQAISCTFNGHLNQIRTLDVNPFIEYYVGSGGNDNTVRLWDARINSKSIKTYRGHIANVNSVKFSPDGLWIASAGTEGSIIIWDIRKSRQIMTFTERSSSITCIQFHPYEFLLAAGRGDGSVHIYDLEKQQLVSKTEPSKHPVKCIAFSEKGECLFIGSSGGISVVGWEPDRIFDSIESAWTFLGDMKIVNKKLICASYDDDTASIHALSVGRVAPFIHSNTVTSPPVGPQDSPFSYNQTARKSFTRGSQKLKLSLNSTKPPQNSLMEESEEQSSPSLSIELVDDDIENIEIEDSILPDTRINQFDNRKDTPSSLFTSLSSMSSSSGPSSMPGERKMMSYDENIHMYNENNPPIISNYDDTEEIEDFTVNSAQPPDYAPKISSKITSLVTLKQKSTMTTNKKAQKIGSQLGKMNYTGNLDYALLNGEASTTTSSNTGTIIDLRKLTVKARKETNKENVKSKQQRNIPVTIVTNKPPVPLTRAKTASELKNNQNRRQHPPQNHRPVQKQGLQNATTQNYEKTTNDTITPTINSNTNISNINYNDEVKDSNCSNFNGPLNLTPVLPAPPSALPRKNLFGMNPRNDDQGEINMLVTYHEQIYTELANRYAMLLLIRNTTKTQDIVEALKEALKQKAKAVFVDILGAVLENTSIWSLDLCLVLLPEIYILLQSPRRYHHKRGCDALRILLSNFLPIIKENMDSWARTSCIGVDISREERHQKCLECHHWLQRIGSLEVEPLGSSLPQLQSLIVNIG